MVRKIAIELYDVRNRNVGLGEFTYQIAVRLAQRAPLLREKYGVELHFIVDIEWCGAFGNEVKYIIINQFNRKRIRLFTKVDLLHVTHQYCRVKNMYRAKENLMTVHDINFMYEKLNVTQQIYIDKFRRRLKLTSALSYISNFAKSDVEYHFAPGHPSRVIYNGVTNLATGAYADITQMNLPTGYLLHISSLQPKKNPHLLVEMMCFLPGEHLVIVGNWDSDYARKIKARIEELKLKNITTLNHVSVAEKAAIFNDCKGFLFPSLCEGFGLPPLEAACFAKPMFLSTLTSLPEVGGNLAYYWDELKPQPMAEVVEQGLADFYSHPQKAEQTRTWAARFDWDKCVDEYIDYYLDLLKIKKV